MNIEKKIESFIIKKNIEIKKISQLNSILHSILIYPNGIIGMVFLKTFFLVLIKLDRFKIPIFKLKNIHMKNDYSQLFNILLNYSNNLLVKSFIVELIENFYVFNDENKELDILFETNIFLLYNDQKDLDIQYRLLNNSELQKYKDENPTNLIINSKLFVIIFNMGNFCLIGYMFVNIKEISLYISNHNYIEFNQGTFQMLPDPLIKVMFKTKSQ